MLVGFVADREIQDIVALLDAIACNALEYEGADPSYQTLCLYYLALLDRERPAIVPADAFRRAVDFVSYSVHPDGTYGGLYGARRAGIFYPGGIALLARTMPLADAIARFMRLSITAGHTITLTDVDSGNKDMATCSKYYSYSGGTINSLQVYYPAIGASSHFKVAVYDATGGGGGAGNSEGAGASAGGDAVEGHAGNGGERFDTLTEAIEIEYAGGVVRDLLRVESRLQAADYGPLVGGDQTTEVNSSDPLFERIDFANKTSVTVNGQGSAETISLDNSTPATGLTNLDIEGNTGNGNITVASASTLPGNITLNAQALTDNGALTSTGGNITQAAKILGCVRDTLASKIKKKGIDPKLVEAG